MSDDEEGRRSRNRPFWVKSLEDSDEILKAYARGLANGRTYDAEDLVQETACRALSCSKEPCEIMNPAGYLLRIMRNIWIDKWAGENSANMESLEKLLDAGRHPAVEPVVEQSLESRELQDEMSVRGGPLTPRESLLLELHLRGYNCKEIAERLGENVRLTRSDLNAVKSKVRYRLTKRRAKAAASGRP